MFWSFAQVTISTPGMVPFLRAISWPWWKIIKQRILWIYKLLAISFSASIFTLAKRIVGSNTVAVLLNAVDIIWQYPHPGAQKMIIIEISLRWVKRAKFATDNSTGLAWKSRSLHLPHLGSPVGSRVGTRLIDQQFGQTICDKSVTCIISLYCELSILFWLNGTGTLIIDN